MIGKDKDKKYDVAHNSSSSGPVITTPDGITTISPLLPFPYGQDGYFQGAKYLHAYDKNLALFSYLKYNTDSKKLEWETDINQVSEFKVFWNVEK